MNIMEAIRHLKTGKLIKRKEWKTSNAINSVGMDYNGLNDYTPLFTIDDILADDWEVVE